MITTRGRRLWLVVGAAVVVAVLAVTAVGWAAMSVGAPGARSNGSTSDGSVLEAPPVGEPALPEAPGDPAAQQAEQAPDAGRAAAPAPGLSVDPVIPPGIPPAIPLPPVGRDLVRSAVLILDVADLSRAAQGVRDAVARSGGLVADEHVRDGGATLSLQVPAESLDSVLTELGALGTVAERTLGAKDVTEQVVDLEGRLATQQASVARVRALLDRANTIGEIVQIESELTAREAELESVQRRLTVLQNRVAMSSVRVELRGTGAVAEDGFLDGLAGGWNAFLVVGRGLLIAVGAALPFLVVAGLVAAAFVLVRRRMRARRAGAATGETT